MSAWYALLLVALVQAVSLIDRQILAILMPRIRDDLQVGNAELGLLYGTVFGLFYAVFSLPLGRLADGWIRTRLLAISILGWSLMTAFSGMASAYWQLALARLGLGIGEASAQPAGMSLLSDHFPSARRGIASAGIAAAVALGLGGALWIGGSVSDRWDAAFPNGSGPGALKGWQAAFLVASLPGFVLAVLLWRLPEPVRGALDGRPSDPDPHPFAASAQVLLSVLPLLSWLALARQRVSGRVWAISIAAQSAIALACVALHVWTASLRPSARALFQVAGWPLTANQLQWITVGVGLCALFNWFHWLSVSDRRAFDMLARARAMRLLMAIIGLQMIINYGMMAWTPAHLVGAFGQSPASVGLRLGFITAAGGIVGPLVAGLLADRLHRVWRHGRLSVTLVSLTVSPAFMVATYRAGSVDAFYALFVAYSLSLTLWLPPLLATLMDLVQPRYRGSAMSLYVLVTTLFGLCLGPYAVGLFADVGGGSGPDGAAAGAIGAAILSLGWLCPLVALLALGLLLVAPRDIAGAQAPDPESRPTNG